MSDPLTPADGGPQPRIQSVSRAARILREVAASSEGLRVREISELLGLSRPTTYHLVHTLGTEGFLRKDDSGRYCLGLGIGFLTEAFGRQLGPPEHLLPLIRTLSLKTGETAYVVGWSVDEIVALSFVPGSHAVGVADFPIGLVGDAHARASGKLLLAYASPAKRAEYLRTHPLRSLTPNTITDLSQLEQEFARIRERGYSIDNEEYARGVCCLAVPIDAGTSSYGLSVSAPKERFSHSFDDYLQAALETVRAASGSGRERHRT